MISTKNVLALAAAGTTAVVAAIVAIRRGDKHPSIHQPDDTQPIHVSPPLPEAVISASSLPEPYRYLAPVTFRLFEEPDHQLFLQAVTRSGETAIALHLYDPINRSVEEIADQIEDIFVTARCNEAGCLWGAYVLLSSYDYPAEHHILSFGGAFFGEAAGRTGMTLYCHSQSAGYLSGSDSYHFAPERLDASRQNFLLVSDQTGETETLCADLNFEGRCIGVDD